MTQDQQQQMAQESPQRSKDSVWLSLQYAKEMLQYAQRADTPVGQLKWISDAQKRINWAKQMLQESPNNQDEK